MTDIEALAVAPSNLWGVEEAARFLGFSASWVYHRAEAGLLPHIKLGGRLRFEQATLADFVRRSRLSSTTVLERLKRK